MNQTTGHIPPDTEPTDRPLRQSPVDMSWNDWHALLDRYLAGEPIRALCAAFRVSPSSVHRNARKFGKRKKDCKAAVRMAKGPPPLTVTTGDGRVLDMVCADLAFTFDRNDPGATRSAIFDRTGEAAMTGADRRYMRLMRMAEVTERVLVGPASRRRSAETTRPDPEDLPAAPIQLRLAQTPPDGDWSTWLFLGGRGAGKTLAGASWLADQAELLGPGGRLALVGPTLHDVREVMIEGPSGLRSLPRWTRADRPAYEPSRRRLVFANGCIAHAFSAEDPDSLRGPQFSGAWADEFCAWRAVGARGAGETLALLRMGLRLPLVRAQAASDRVASVSAPRLVVTTTPRPTRALITLRDEPSCALTHAGTADNAEHLSPGFLDELRTLYGGTRREAQEIEGRIVDLAGALFTAEMMAGARLPSPDCSVPSPLAGEGGPEGRMRGETPICPGTASDPSGLPAETDPSSERLRRPPSPSRGEGSERRGEGPFEKIIVALDPTTTVTGDACGIIVAASRRRPDGVREAVVLADRSAHGLSPDQWARRAVQAAREFNAGAMVAEVNQGGDMVRAVLKTAGNTLRVREVRATKGKRVRAEPVAALYEQGRVRHAPADGVPLSALEEELMSFAGEMEGAGSLDRADALVWAVTHLLIDAPEGERGPRVRRL